MAHFGGVVECFPRSSYSGNIRTFGLMPGEEHIENGRQCLNVPYFLVYNHGKEFLAYIKVNEFEEVPVRCILYQSISPVLSDDTDSYDILNITDVPECPPKTWKFSFNEPLFEEQRKKCA